MAFKAGQERLTIERLHDVARKREPVEISSAAMDRIKKCRAFLDRKIEQQAVMYGVTTGIGELSEVVLTQEQIQDFQKYLVYSHTAGYGDPVAPEDVRGAMTSRIQVLCQGHSGPRPVVVETLAAMLNKDVVPVMCQRGSVGASGDLSPMGQLALVVMGEGEAFYKGERMSGKAAMDKAGIPTLTLEARDGLAIINGSNVTAGMSANQFMEALRLIRTAEIATAMSVSALNGNMLAYDERIHRVRGYAGAVACAANVRKITAGGEFMQAEGKRVQDAYALRSTPQVTGAARDSLRFVREMVETELNGVGDNPIFFPDEEQVLTGANFQGTPLAVALETMGTCITMLGALSERRLNRLMNPHLSMGLPAFLTKGAGMFSGMMLTQYSAGALVCENRILSHPAATGSIPAAADQEDFVSMSMTSAIKTKQILHHTDAILAIELMGAAQGLELRGWKMAPGVQAAFD
ncbi:MAG: phenylalanine ammonia-lyase, partial [Candidatus Eisenbacteria bacterium]|nr:phenylalanine ammonia-lyase [Candidatus Eisenbacteria bacterium]